MKGLIGAILLIFPLILVSGWLIVTWLGFRYARRFTTKDKNHRLVRFILVAVFGSVWVWVSYWYGIGRKADYNAQVRELCAKDGGVRIYETVTLPADRFDRSGNVNIPSKERVKPKDRYYYDITVTYLRRGDPEIWRSEYKVVRTIDKKVLGESIQYTRRGGDLFGVGNPSSYGCSDIESQPSLYKSLFQKGN